MDDLIKTITEKFGIDADKASGIVGTVGEFLADKLPGPIGGQVSKLLGGGGDDDDGDDGGDDDGGGLLGKAKGLLGG
ncbi:MAG: hypothetical protein OEM22_03535 [Acidimicrobiia bacterium]|nr:hypothetical protein [Acidimicrobiia bacterium]MDH3471749.1 hypothetical protein [Acidimicrobiia bacterium]